MSKSKTKQARRQLKRDGQRKIAEHQKKTAKAAIAATKPSKPTSSAQKPPRSPQQRSKRLNLQMPQLR